MLYLSSITLLQQLTRKYKSSVLLVTHNSRILDFADRHVQIENGILEKYRDSPLYSNGECGSFLAKMDNNHIN